MYKRMEMCKGSALTWWSKNGTRFEYLSTCFRWYHSAPATSVDSERLFSGAGLLYQPKRRRLHGSMAEKLLFIKYNLKTKNVD